MESWSMSGDVTQMNQDSCHCHLIWNLDPCPETSHTWIKTLVIVTWYGILIHVQRRHTHESRLLSLSPDMESWSMSGDIANMNQDSSHCHLIWNLDPCPETSQTWINTLVMGAIHDSLVTWSWPPETSAVWLQPPQARIPPRKSANSVGDLVKSKIE